jgi:hypothetical protein
MKLNRNVHIICFRNIPSIRRCISMYVCFQWVEKGWVLRRTEREETNYTDEMIDTWREEGMDNEEKGMSRYGHKYLGNIDIWTPTVPWNPSVLCLYKNKKTKKKRRIWIFDRNVSAGTYLTYCVQLAGMWYLLYWLFSSLVNLI